jgi:hypothetical protein
MLKKQKINIIAHSTDGYAIAAISMKHMMPFQ